MKLFSRYCASDDEHIDNDVDYDELYEEISHPKIVKIRPLKKPQTVEFDELYYTATEMPIENQILAPPTNDNFDNVIDDNDL